MTLLYLTLLIYLVQANTVQRARDVRPVFGPMLWASVVDGGPALVRRWAGVPCLLGGYPLCVGSVLVHVFGAVPALPQHWVDPGVCWDLQYCVIMLIFAVSFSIYVFFYYIHFGVTYKPKWAGYYEYCKHIYNVIGSVCTCHYNKNIQYNTI